MAKINGINTKISGQVGEVVYRQTASGTVVSEARRVPSIPQRTSRQMDIRTQWANLAAVYKLFGGMLRKGFEGLPPKMSVYNAFIQANLGVVKVYITKATRMNGGCVLTPYQITRGTLPSIDIERGASGRLQTSLRLGGLEIGDQTTVGEFARAILDNNDEFMAYDQLTFFHGEQYTDRLTRIPRAKMHGYRVVLDPQSEVKLHEKVSKLGFSTLDGCLGSGEPVEKGAVAWVHSRDLDGEPLRVSTQMLYVVSDDLARYQGEAALAESVESYGGINASAVYLQPVHEVLTNG